MIYLDHNATTPLHPRVLQEMLPFLQERWGNPSSPHRLGADARQALDQARERIARRLQCRPEELIFCGSGTEADNLALRGVARALRARGDGIVTSAIEHPAVLATCAALAAEGFRVTHVPVDGQGRVQPAALAAALDEGTILVSLMHANNETGVLQPLAELAELTRARGIVLHTDAVQTAGKVPLQPSLAGADLITLSGHKLYGPKGIGVLVARAGTPLLPVIAGGGQEQGRRSGTENVAAIVGLAAALELVTADLAAEAAREGELRELLETQVRQRLAGVTIHGAGAPRVPGTSSLSFTGVDGESLVLGLDLQGICVSTGSACSTGDPEPSHVLLAMGVPPRQAQGTIRISLGRETRAEDITRTVDALVDTVERLRRISSI
ncbi:MAG: cysteine desulfurase family protein [Myxococcota bacterium]|nr:cysteine desulfurase family protein [Myxococcota bacterium]